VRALRRTKFVLSLIIYARHRHELGSDQSGERARFLLSSRPGEDIWAVLEPQTGWSVAATYRRAF
jgi:hypothetical protein